MSNQSQENLPLPDAYLGQYNTLRPIVEDLLTNSECKVIVSEDPRIQRAYNGIVFEYRGYILGVSERKVNAGAMKEIRDSRNDAVRAVQDEWGKEIFEIVSYSGMAGLGPDVSKQDLLDMTSNSGATIVHASNRGLQFLLKGISLALPPLHIPTWKLTTFDAEKGSENLLGTIDGVIEKYNEHKKKKNKES